ncbi:MAG: HAD-IIA family hydrolase [Anaerolineales bacterium]|jgi:4-nitrophenyl phosphatase|nr:HAD-IIA family hydrolase [Anaerolineales bacterium]
MTALKALLLDMDGVLWRGTQPIGSVPDNLAAIAAKGLQAAFVTNNSTLTVEQYQEKFRKFGAEVDARQIHTSANASAHYLQQQFPQGGNVFVIGEEGLQQAMLARGFTLADHDCIAVVAGLDRQLSYDKLRSATLQIAKGAAFIGTNPDRTLPSPDGPVPGAGSILAAIQAASGVQPTIIGKPGTAGFMAAMDALGVSPAETMMIGDRVDTDIAGAQAAGCRTGLVLSGITTAAEAQAWQPAPDHIAADLATLLAALP